MQKTIWDKGVIVFALVMVTDVASASSQLIIYGKAISTTWLWVLYGFISAYYYSKRAFNIRRDAVSWWIASWPLSIAIMVVAVMLINNFFGSILVAHKEGLAVVLAIVITIVVANLLVSRMNTSVLTMVCLVASIPMVLVAIVSFARPYGILDHVPDTGFKSYLKKHEIVKDNPRQIKRHLEMFPPEFVAMKNTNQRFFEISKRRNFPFHDQLISRAKVIKRVKRKPQIKLVKSHTRRGNRWVLQIASFSIKRNASRLRDKLKRRGYKAYITKRLGSTIRYRVRVGPIILKSQADRLNKRLSSEQNLKGILLRVKAKIRGVGEKRVTLNYSN